MWSLYKSSKARKERASVGKIGKIFNLSRSTINDIREQLVVSS